MNFVWTKLWIFVLLGHTKSGVSIRLDSVPNRVHKNHCSVSHGESFRYTIHPTVHSLYDYGFSSNSQEKKKKRVR